MSNRSWFFASNGQQQGPYPEPQFRDMIARGQVSPQTLVWSEGMAGWLRAAEVPGLMSGGMAPPAMPPGGGAMMGGGGYGAPTGGGYAAGGTLSVDFGIWDFTWRTIVYFLGFCTVIAIPWVYVWYTKWIVSCVRVPGRPNLSFTGNAMTMLPWFVGLVVLYALPPITGIQALSTLASIGLLVATWLLIRWQVANIASNEQPVGLSFVGSFWAFFGWNLLLGVSFITIIGWAWVYTAQMRWYCRNVQGTRREIVFKGTGLQFLWRTLVVGLLSGFIIPIPWLVRWLMGWIASQTELVDRGAYQGQ